MKFFQLTFSICLSNPMVMYKNYNRFSLLFKYLVNIQNKWRKIDYYRIRAVPLAIAVVQPYKYWCILFNDKKNIEKYRTRVYLMFVQFLMFLKVPIWDLSDFPSYRLYLYFISWKRLQTLYPNIQCDWLCQIISSTWSLKMVNNQRTVNKLKIVEHFGMICYVSYQK